MICNLVSIYFNSTQLGMQWKKLYKTLDYSSSDMLNFDFSEKGLGLVFPPHFVYDFLSKMFLMLYSISWPNFTVWLPLLREILHNMCIAIVCFPGCDFINFEINLIFLIKPFLKGFQLPKIVSELRVHLWKCKNTLRSLLSVILYFFNPASKTSQIIFQFSCWASYLMHFSIFI